MSISSPNAPKSPSALRTIGEVAEQLSVPQHVLRFWEGKFNQITPEKHRGRRYYRQKDIALLEQIKLLLYTEGYTIKGVQNFLYSVQAKPDSIEQPDLFLEKEGKTAQGTSVLAPIETRGIPSQEREALQAILKTLQEARDVLQHSLEDPHRLA